ncbi:MAG: hypothetical protein KKE02_03235 [Alphaproteobacteria bacterium]|nr:hypothetical protein [Alphaproteobacteria bacterium]MBU1512785.1 hypothetical protein [Alphaproteobacteria bacterium]MBU2093961.1 hypothetical protein [Alphaproteobacteria bacterium]MBU2150011.1 hypothetical protein [Alphaproteobacteria bacterium]MBU2306448.1 hypothetical protein [Alphaproteobacteria bacterium]
MTAADSRCGLFTPEVSAALAAGAAQARGAALRAGTDTKTLAGREAAARRYAGQLNCRNPKVLAEAARVQQAFSGYARVTRMTYPGDAADWRADRGSGKAARWRLAQDTAFSGGRMTFGLAGREGANALVAVADFADGQTPYAARLVLRDGTRTLGPYLDTRGKAAPLSRKLPPPGATRSYMAEARSEADEMLLPKGSEDAWAFRFPATAAQALADLDPREAIAIEFLFSGERTRTAYVEVGDFAAGRAFLQVASR